MASFIPKEELLEKIDELIEAANNLKEGYGYCMKCGSRSPLKVDKRTKTGYVLYPTCYCDMDW